MATFVGLHNRVLFGHLNLTGLTKTVNFGDLSRAMQDCTTYADGGYTCVQPGLISGTATVEGYQDWTTDSLDDEISVGQLGTSYPITVIPNPTGTVTTGDTCWFSRGTLAKLNPMSGAKGDMAGFLLESAYDTAITRGLVAHAGTAVTTSSSDSAVALVGPTSSQKLYAALHVTAYSGFSSVAFTVESDDNANFTSATTRITFASVTGTTSEFASVAGGFATETHHRIKVVCTGSGSVTYTAAFGVI